MSEREPIAQATNKPKTFFIEGENGEKIECIRVDGRARRYSEVLAERRAQEQAVASSATVPSQPLEPTNQPPFELATPPPVLHETMYRPPAKKAAPYEETPHEAINDTSDQQEVPRRRGKTLASVALVGGVGLGTFWGVGYAVERDLTIEVTNGQQDVSFPEHFLDTVNRLQGSE